MKMRVDGDGEGEGEKSEEAAIAAATLARPTASWASSCGRADGQTQRKRIIRVKNVEC